ncbi:MAG TPA: PH domain-containing protein [Acidimicrobiia bacterium]|nr:PH domain-containing protein [Acidimicrobiia bacterium]
MTTPPVEEWRRLHPLTILKEIGALAWAIVAALVFDFDWDFQSPALPDGFDADSLIAIVVFGYAIIRYLSTAYRLTDQTLDLRRGVLFKSSQSMPRDRVQTVAVTTPLIGRLAGVSTVEISAADTEDITLAYVSSAHAERLRRILEARRHPADEGESEAEPEAARVPLADLPFHRLFLYTVTNGWLLLGVGTLIVGGVLALVFGFVLAPFAVAVALGGWSGAKALGLVEFRSWLQADRIQVEAGLLSRRETEAPLARIQAIGVSRPLIRRLVGQESVEMATGELSLGSDSLAITKGILAPLVEIGTWRRLAEQVIGSVDLGETDLRPSSPHTLRRTAVRGIMGTVVVTGLAVVPGIWLETNWWLPGVVALIGIVASVLYARARYRALGWAIDSRHLLVRGGVLNRRLAVVPIHKVQDVSLTETFFQRWLGIATVEVDTAGVAIPGSSLAAGIRAVDLTREDARGLADRLVAAAARVSLPDGV